MKRFLTVALSTGMALGAVSAFAQTDSTASTTFYGKVGTIVKFITNKTTPATLGTGIDTWDVTDTGSVNYTDSTAVFRLVMNQDVVLKVDSGSSDLILTETGAGATGAADTDTLATFWTLYTDGDGQDPTTPTVFTGQAWTGIDTPTVTTGVSTAAGAAKHFSYLGGASASATDSPTFQVPNAGDSATYYYGASDTSWSATPPTTATLAVADWLDSAGSGTTITHIDRDGAVLITVTCRGFNGESFTADSDATEAPDVADYEATLVLDAF
ncbi:MAG: hypothetical protein O3A46_12210 [Candidatus Poribacteria bacterium]|nr:hypothetical protein [Candidatus Poribacteria bacterium]